MKITVWGSRGSIGSAGPETVRYGGNTSCVSVESGHAIVILDAGSGLRAAGLAFAADTRPIHILLTHLHMDHIQGLGFFRPLFEPGRPIHIWGPPSTTQDLRTRLTRYLSPPLFPVRIRDFGAAVELHDAPLAAWRVRDVALRAASAIHPGPTLGYRLTWNRRSVAYLSDHEPALGSAIDRERWTSGFDLADSVDVLLHDGQYTADGIAIASDGATAASSTRPPSRTSPAPNGSSCSTTIRTTRTTSSTRCSSARGRVVGAERPMPRAKV